jgi:hypothetical protein
MKAKHAKAEANAGSLKRRERMKTTRANAGSQHHAVGAPKTLKHFHVGIAIDYSRSNWKTVSRRWGVSKPTIDKCHRKYKSEAASLLEQLESPGFRDGRAIGDRAAVEAGIKSYIKGLAETFKALSE